MRFHLIFYWFYNLIHKFFKKGGIMDFVRDELEKLVRNLCKLEENYNSEFVSSPLGSLLNNRTCGKPHYFHSYYDDNGDWHRISLPPGDPMIEILARKEYLRLSLPNIRKNIELLEQMLSRYRSLDPADIITASRRAYRLLNDSSFFSNKHENALWETVGNLEMLTDDMIRYRCEEHREWATREYTRNPYPFRTLHLTDFGLRVRSRGEIVIAEVAHTLGIPFRYDQLITLEDGSTISPDFSFEDKYFEEFYIEYCGMMDDPGYVRSHLIKRGRYEQNGINEWNNIRYIYSKDDSLNAVEIKHILLDWVVPRL